MRRGKKKSARSEGSGNLNVNDKRSLVWWWMGSREFISEKT